MGCLHFATEQVLTLNLEIMGPTCVTALFLLCRQGLQAKVTVDVQGCMAVHARSMECSSKHICCSRVQHAMICLVWR